MGYCPQCGSLVAEGATFCDSCGARLPAPPMVAGWSRGGWTGAIVGAAIAFVFLVITNYALLAVQLRDLINRIPPQERPPAALVSDVRRLLLGGAVYGAHLVSFHGSMSANMKAAGASGSGSVQLSVLLPIAGALLLPALALVLGGYVAGRASQARTVSEGARRGALIGMPYAVLLLLSLVVLPVRFSGDVAELVARYGGTSAFPGAALGSEQAILNVTAGPSLLGLLVFGILWGSLFGAVGGTWAAGGSVRTAVREALGSRLGQWAPGAYGALAALALGLILATVVTSLGVLAEIRKLSAPQTRSPTAPSSVESFRLSALDVATLAVYGAPTVGVWSYPLLHGLPAGFEVSVRGGSESVAGRGEASLLSRAAVITGRLPGEPEEREEGRLPPWTLLGLLVPAVALTFGGRVARALSQGQSHALAGARVGACYAIGLLAVWYFSRISWSGAGTATVPTFLGTQTVRGSFHLGAGYSLAGTLIAGLAWGVVFGTLGAWSAGGSRRFCDACGAPVTPGPAFCDHCGARL